jgi:flagellar biosynthesis protein FlhF
MRLRRFSARDTATAMRQVREALGPEALILATRAGEGGGVEITAAVDVDCVTDSVAPPAPAAKEAAAFERLTSEIKDLGLRVRAIDRRLGPLTPAVAELGAETAELAERLALQGLAPHLACAIAVSFATEKSNGRTDGAALVASLGCHLRLDARGTPGRVSVFVGPTGAGKTTTIAKLAAARVARGGIAPGLIMADTYRTGAAEQLGAYARLLNVPMCVVRDAGDLERAFADFANREQILVDTAGISGDGASAADVARLLAGAAGGQRGRIEVVAVVSATASDGALRSAWRRMEALEPATCVVTKLDEGAGAGTACTWLHEVGLRLRWLGTGQRVPEDLQAANGTALARWLGTP